MNTPHVVDISNLPNPGVAVPMARWTELLAAEQERDALRAWKESALAVEREWDCQALAKMLGVPLGHSCRKGIMQGVPALLADKARLDWLQEHACEEGRTMAMPRYAYRVAQWEGNPGPNIRSAIDSAIKATP